MIMPKCKKRLTDPKPPLPSAPMRQFKGISWVGLILILLLSGLIRYHLIDAPLERDEGEYAYAGQLILQGVPPYSEVYNMKLPGIYGIYALLLTVFGQTPRRPFWTACR